MSNLANRLRRALPKTTDPTLLALLNEAADELERLGKLTEDMRLEGLR